MSSESHLRTFIAVDVSEDSRQALGRLQEQLRPLCGGITWVRPEQMHLTLLFLGTTPAGRIEEVTAALDRVVSHQAIFAYHLRGLGWFGPPRRPRVLWAGVSEDQGHLQSLRQAVVNAVRALNVGHEAEDPYVPHLTLARIRTARSEELQRLMERVGNHHDTAFGSTRVDAVRFLASTLTSQGPLYQSLHTAWLGKETVAPPRPVPDRCALPNDLQQGPSAGFTAPARQPRDRGAMADRS